MNGNIDTDDLQAFLIETELVNQKVKALANNQLSPQQFDRIQAAKAEDFRKRQQTKKRKQKELEQKKRMGRSGKGINKDFANFCRFCHWEYQLETNDCLRCKKPTMTLQQRRQQLEVMVEQYKQKKKSREDRKHRWEMWQKTKSMLWKKTSNNYDKWQYFISDSEEEPDQEPIVPKNDPNFKALERDVQERKLKRQKDTQKAKKLKQKGNAEMKNGNYVKAIEYYHLALEHIKDIKSIYTNRALAYLKIGKYDKAIKDCSNVIDYMEVFGKSGECIDLLFKAHLRRASAYKQKKEYKQALEDINKALEIYPKDQSSRILKKEIEAFLSHSQTVAQILKQSKPGNNEPPQPKQAEPELPTQEEAENEERDIIKEIAEAQMKVEAEKKQEDEESKQQIKNVQKAKPQQNEIKSINPIEQIKELLENLTLENIQLLFRLIRSKSENMAIFLAAKGIKKCLAQLIDSEESKKQGFLVSICLKGDGIGEAQVWEFGVEKLHNKITQILDKPNQMSMGVYFLLQDIFEVLIPMSLHEKYRPILSSSQSTAKFFESTFSRLITKDKKHPDLLSSFLIYGGNLCSGASKLRDNVIGTQIFVLLMSTLFDKILTRKTSNRSYTNLKKNVFGFYANLIINETHRKSFCQYFTEVYEQNEMKLQRWDQLIKDLRTYPVSQNNFTEYSESLLSVFVNTLLGTKQSIPNLTECINSRFLQNPKIYSPEILNRSLTVLTRLKHTSTKQLAQIVKNLQANIHILMKVDDQRLMENIIRLLNVIYSPIEVQGKKQVYADPIPENILNLAKSYISSIQFGEALFCNSCNLFCVLIDSAATNPLAQRNKDLVMRSLKGNMKFLIEVAKEKVGNWRKNASILLAKLSLNPECREELNKHHGMDVLRSIAQYVKQ